MPAAGPPTVQPGSAEALVEVIAEARAARRRIEVIGGGSKRGIGAVAAPDLLLAMDRMDKVVDYAPEELVLTVQAGVRLAALETLVAKHGQMLPFEPPHLGRLLGSKARPTIGGTVAANLSGPRRIKAGAARDHVLGFTAVSGRGELFKAGGKVVKNVTGYDLGKLIAGSWGTLAVITEVTLKVLPAPRGELTLTLFGLDDRRAGEAMTLALGSPAEVSGAAHLPAFAARRPPLGAELSVTALRLEGFAASIQARAEALALALKGFGAVGDLDAEHSRGFWAQVREVEAFRGDPRPLWRISLPPAAGWRLGSVRLGDMFYDWAGGLVWLLSDRPAADVRAAVRAQGGYAVRYRGPGPGAFEPLEGPLAALTGRVKAAFDPDTILNPGRLEG